MSTFEVTLSFNGQKKNVLIPFRSISSFTDPSVGFGLQFKIDNNLNLLLKILEKEKDQSSQISSIELNEKNKSGQIVSLDEFRDKNKSNCLIKEKFLKDEFNYSPMFPVSEDKTEYIQISDSIC